MIRAKSRSERSGGTEGDVPDEFSSSARGAAPHCGDYQMEPQGGLSPRKPAEGVKYDPRDPSFVRPATELEKADADLAVLRRQLARMRAVVAKRSRTEPCSPVVCDYQRRVREMESELEEAEARRASLAAAAPPDPDFQAVPDHKRRASCCSSTSAEGSSCSTRESLQSDFGAEEASGALSVVLMA